MKKIYFFCILSLFTNLNFAQTRNDSPPDQVPFIYLDCDRCDYDYIKTEVPFVNFVRERKEAQIHILVSTQGTGSGGEEFTLTFIGQKNFTGKNDTLTFYSQQNATDEEIRKSLVQRLKLGLIPYVAKTPVADQVDIIYKKPETPKQRVKDKWNYWVFRVNVNTFLNGERLFNFISLFGTILANRITNNWKTRLSFTAGYDESTFTIGSSKVRTFQKSFGFEDYWLKVSPTTGQQASSSTPPHPRSVIPILT